MKVIIKDFKVEMEVKTSGIEFEVRTANNEDQLGDFIVTKSAIIWCKGKTDRKNGISLAWDKFISLMESMQQSKPPKTITKKQPE